MIIPVFLPLLMISFVPVSVEQPEISFDIWDWTAPARDLKLFELCVEDLAELGFTRIELSVPWRLLEPEPHVYDLVWLQERIEVCEQAGLGMRLRINSYYGGATPEWFDGDRWLDKEDHVVSQAPPSIMDDRFWVHYGPLCTKIAALCKGKDVLHNAFIGIHAELKYGDWWSYDASTLAAWRAAIASPRPAWLLDLVDDAPLPERPEAPPDTRGMPDTTPAHLAFIAFREQCWREAVQRFEAAIRQGDPDARISAPLGESYRRQSAHMANLDYWGLSRSAMQVVHSYDFFWHIKDPAWMAAASVDAFRGITGLPVVFEFDATQGMFGLGYSQPHLLALGAQAASAGAGLKLANNSYLDTLPSKQPLIRELVQLWREAWRPVAQTPREQTVLLFFSKWANYTYRESTEWLYEAQFGVYKLLRDSGIPVRIITEDNLDEDLDGYRALYMAFSPRPLLPAWIQHKLEALSLLIIEDFVEVPSIEELTDHLTEGIARVAVDHTAFPVGPQDLSRLGSPYQFGLQYGEKQLLAYRKNHVVMGYPVGAMYLHDASPVAHQGLVLWALQQR